MKQQITVAPSAASPVVAFRLPQNGTTDPYFGCARTFWNSNVLPSQNNGVPPIKSVVVKKAGTKRGIRLIMYDSAKAYFKSLADQQNQAEASA